MGNTKSLVLVIASLIFLVSGVVCSQLSALPVLAAIKDPCFDSGSCPNRGCENNLERGTATCCWTDRADGETVCQTCDVNTDIGEFENCTDVRCISCAKGLPGPGIIAPPPVGVAPPPLTETCPENTALDAQGNCTPLTQGPQETLQSPEEIAPIIDCAQNPDDPLCDTARIPEGPEGLTPQVDCNENPDDPLCETATIPEDQGNDGGEDNTGEDSNSDGG